jgi:vitamin B12 transporter
MRSIYLSSLAALALATPAHAQDAGGSEEVGGEIILAHDRPIETIIVVGAGQEIRTLANSVTRITEYDLERLQQPAISDVLARLSGVTATRNGPIGGFTGVRIRGADASQTLVLINGVRVADPTSPGGGFDFGNLLSGNIAAIDVQRGSNSVTWGSDAIGGVVLVRTGGRNGFSAEYGSHNSRRANGQWSIDGDDFSVNAGGGYFATDGISAAQSGNEADGFRQYAANFDVVGDLTDNLTLGGNIIYANSRLAIDGFAPPTFSFGDTAEFQRSQEVYASAAASHRLGYFTHQIIVTLADINRDTFDPASGATPTFVARGRSERLTWQAQYEDISVNLIGGVDREWSRSLTANSFSADAGRTAVTGFFGNATITASDQFSFGLGARHDEHRQFGGNTVFSGNARFQVSDVFALRGSYAEGFKAPTLFQLSGTPSSFGNPALEPERSRGGDIGIVWQPGYEATVRATLFRRDSRNLIDFIGCAGPAAPPICAGGTRPFGTYANIARARAEGVELELLLRPVYGITLTGAYSYIDARDRSIGTFNSGNRLARRPQHSATLSVDYDLDGIAIGGDVQLVGDSFDDAGNFSRLDGYALVNLRGSVAVSDEIDLYARVENLFDADYQNVAGFGTYGRTFAAGVRAVF